MRFDPFRDVDRLADELYSRAAERSVPLDAYRRADELIMHFDLPGVNPDSIELTVENDVLLMKATRGWSAQPGDELLVRERYQGEYVRRVILGSAVDTAHVKALYDDGVLTVHLPVAEKAKKRTIDVTRIHAGNGGKKAVKV